MKRSQFHINLVLCTSVAAIPLLFALPIGAQVTPNGSESNNITSDITSDIVTSNIVQREVERQDDEAAVENHNEQRPRASKGAATPERPTEMRTSPAVAYSDVWSDQVEKMGDE
jgi:hypothetical protein